MRTLLFTPLLFGLALAVAVLPSAAADKTDPEQINKLIQQLGSGDFAEREKATRELDALGTKALDALRKAAKSDDAEISRRAEELVKKWERLAETEKILAPTKIRLVFKDTPIKDAVTEVQKKTGLTITLHDPENKLADRKVTVDTGETTLLEAFDLFCEKAGLIEGDPRTLIQPITPLPRPTPPKGLPLNPPPNPNPIPFKNDEAPKPAPKEETPPAKPAPAPAPAPVPAPAPGGGGVVLQLQIGPVPPAGGPAVMPPMAYKPGFNPYGINQIVLVDGKDPKLPTCYNGAVRIRALPAGTEIPGVAKSKDEIQVVLQVTPEPKLQWRQALGVRVDKAVDDQDQNLTQVVAKGDEQGNPAVGVIGIGRGPIARPMIRFPGVNNTQVAVRLKKAEKDSKTLKQLNGSISAQVLTPAETLMSVDKVLKAKGESAKGEGGSLKVLDVSTDDKGAVTLQVEIEMPPDVVPTQGQATFPNNALPGGGPVPPAPGGGLVRVPAAQPTYTGGFQGLSLVDEKGQSLPLRVTGSKTQRAGNAFVTEHALVYQPEKGQGEAAKLLFSASRLATVEVAFTLKDVPVQ
jgi:hypothetical protein